MFYCNRIVSKNKATWSHYKCQHRYYFLALSPRKQDKVSDPAMIFPHQICIDSSLCLSSNISGTIIFFCLSLIFEIRWNFKVWFCPPILKLVGWLRDSLLLPLKQYNHCIILSSIREILPGCFVQARVLCLKCNHQQLPMCRAFCHSYLLLTS